MALEPARFKQNARDALKDQILRKNFRGAMDFLRKKRSAMFPDPEYFATLSSYGESVKQQALSQLSDLLLQLEKNCQNNGIQVWWAENADEANQHVLRIIHENSGHKVVKGKSMVSEETGLNDFLQQHDIECIETDMGEYIVQQSGEHPSHIIMPAIHKNVQQIASLFEQIIPGATYTEDVDTLIRMARDEMRQHFYTADIGITGVNFAVASTGTLCLVENEGNGRMSTTIPKIHIAMMGIEKVVAELTDIPYLLELLTKSATGQAISTYFNMISSPRKEGEIDGPEQVHLILVDNGRSQAYADEELRQTLQCIRCGACMNHCPVYTRIGGHAYGTVYPGPIGKIISPHLLGLESTQDLPTASSLCGACEEVCPVKIPIPKLLQRLRVESNKASDQAQIMRGQGSSRTSTEALIWQIWSYCCIHPRLYHLLSKMAAMFGFMVPLLRSPWKINRAMPKPANEDFMSQYKRKKS